MARKTPPPPEPPLALRVPRSRAEEVLDRHRREGEELLDDAERVSVEKEMRDWLHARSRWRDLTAEGLRAIYTTDGPAEEFLATFHSVIAVLGSSLAEDFAHDRRKVEGAVNKLKSLKERLEYLPGPEDAEPPVTPVAPTAESAVFVIHGHDDARKTEVARLLERTGAHPVTILHEQPNAGRTLIEKFEEHASEAGFAVAILTADDEGGPMGDEPQPRGRQNVVFEMGFFFGRLGRARTAVLYEPGVELPSDIKGLVYIELGAGGAWQFALLKELRAAGLDFDLNKLA